jgi:glycerol-3-phosphate dehydrogenase
MQSQFLELQTDRLLGGTEYFDAQMDDARLCLAVIRSAFLQGARVANYVEAIGFEKRQGKIVGVRARDQVGKSEFVIHSRQVLNATGPWVDEISRMAGDSSGPLLQPTKGVHLIVPKRNLPAALLLLHPADGRVFFVIPWMQKTLIGTTDTVTDEGPDALTVIPAEIDYLLAGFNHYFMPPLQPADVLGTFAGLRPLMRSRPGDPSSLSREYRIDESPSGLISVAGGKYTTYRRMAEVITDAVARRLGRRGPCQTQTFPLDGALPPGSESISQEIEELRQAFARLNEEDASHLVWRYGGRARDVATYLDQDSKSHERIVPGAPDLRGELAYQRDHEMAIFPADFWLRRMRLGLIHDQLPVVG